MKRKVLALQQLSSGKTQQESAVLGSALSLLLCHH